MRRPRLRAPAGRLTVALTAAALAAAGVLAAPAAAAPAPALTAAPGADGLGETDALAAADRLGRPVEATRLKTERSRVLATPRGTLVLETYASPRWTRKQDGWRQIDPTLRRNADGSVEPAATLADVSFSGGGSAPAVRLPVTGGEVSLTWPGVLPRPRLEGDSAIYESVLPGVDLRLRALSDGFTWVLVVTSAEAAANPELDELRFGLHTAGTVTRRARAAGGFEVVDGAGRTLASAGSALMWDSSGLPAPTAGSRASGAEERTQVVRSAPDRARKAELSTTLRGDDLVIRPDPQLLRGAHTSYPVVIDPWTTIGKTNWGYASSQNVTRDDGVARVGLDPSGGGTFRSYFRFSLSTLATKTVRSAKFLTEMTHSWACTSTPVNLWRTADLPASGKQTWSGPAFQLWLEERSGHAHKPSTGSTCSDDPQPDKPLEFSSDNLGTDVRNNRGDGNYTLVLSNRQADGTSESTSTWWKKFDPALTKLSVEYNTPPNTSTAAQLATHADYTAPAQACVTGSSAPAVRSDTPWLKATLTDPDGSNGGTLAGTFALEKMQLIPQENGTKPAIMGFVPVTGWPKTVSGVAPGAKAELRFPTAVTGGRFRWQVQTTDTLGGASDWSTWCEFIVDNTAPATRPAVSSADGLYLESPANQNMQGSPGYSGRFAFAANGSSDVYDYSYQINGGPVAYARADTSGSAMVWVTPNRIGENVLSVRSRDQAGNSSEAKDYLFLVDNHSPLKSHWAMDDGGVSTTLANAVAGAPVANLVNGPVWQDGRILGTHRIKGKDQAVKFDGVDDYALATGVGLDTSRSYSVAAWVRPDADGLMMIAGATGARNDSFMLRKYSDNRWVFTVLEQDSDTTAYTHAFGPAAVKGQWTLVAGSYDQADGKMRLYVNGKEVSSATVPRTFNAGLVTLGRERWAGAPLGHWNGAIGEVRLWDRVLDVDKDLQPLMKPVSTAEWDMSDFDADHRLENDLSDYRHSLALTASPTADPTTDGYDFGDGLVINGAPGSADTDGPVLRTDQSFTASAWVRLTTYGDQTVVAQDGSGRSAFYLMLDGASSRWCITMPTVDVGTTNWQWVMSTSTAQLNTWTHIAAVYDSTSRELRLYVNGQRQGVRPDTVGWQASSALRVGRSLVGYHLDGGTVDQVQLWQGALSDAEVAAEASA